MADINAAPSGYSEQTPLQAAAGNGDMDLIKMLLLADPHVNVAVATDSRLLARQAAAAMGHEALVDLLLSTHAAANTAPAKTSG